VSNGPLVVVGDLLLDVDVIGRVERLSPEAPVPVLGETSQRRRPGGAALAALLASRRREDVILIALWAGDDAAHEIEVLLDSQVQFIPVPWNGSTPVKTRLRAGEHPLARWDTGGAAGEMGPLPDSAARALAEAGAVLVADYGVGLSHHAQLRSALSRGLRRAPLVWDPHPRGSVPVAGADLVTPNAAEAAAAIPDVVGDSLAAIEQRATLLASRWHANAVAITLGERGALLAAGDGTPLIVPAPMVAAADTCGAGDAFAAAAAAAFAAGAVASEAVRVAVEAAARFVEVGGASSVGGHTPDTSATLTAVDGDGSAEDAWVPNGRAATTAAAIDVIRRTRGLAGRVVATGGCFDLLHAGHVGTLEAARRLGDCLVVCLNSDASVRRLKGPGRPLQPEADRARVLAALRCVDAVAVFDEDTPAAVLKELRPDLWVKGGDYTGAVLPETAVLTEWGGAVVTLPYLAGRSTSELMQSARNS
jgi:D-beta-D-heptose 7-phosphate kinase / D-beta-D-heptose 1-phosphate adenosyltransferase